ncbi:hypothetical protein DFH08DRAFT_1014859 [Mycena albidolilacea]|uniref:F-box domain-containing protein n=1 Tax=Mycena albidolilacea TaxID=1033008 RepID=A0AAD6ZT40_9AGAR|nr:hypothetical protein DFH08DRAFT_1014859 [Mycena albidolilacea]
MQSPLEALLTDRTVSVFSARRTRLEFIADIDVALKEVEAAYVSIKAANRSPVKQALNLLRRASKLNLRPMLHDDSENATVVSLAQEVSSGRRTLISLQPSEIQLLQRALRTRRNSLTPISALPTEVLTPILELCPTIAVDGPDFKTANFIREVTLSHVCRRWRAITLKSSTFWSNIILSRPRWALEMLHRSPAAPLAVGVDLDSVLPKQIAARDLVLAQLFRIRELRLHMAAQHLRLHMAAQRIPAPLLLPAPVLETLHLHFSGLSGFAVPVNMFAAEVPRLRHLSLQHCSLQWDSLLWANLVSLELIHSPIQVDLLASMRHLRTLTLIGSISAISGALVQPVPLARLESLTLTGSSLLCCRFLRAVSVPTSRIVLHTPYSAVHMRGVWEALERHRADAAEPVVCGLTFKDRHRYESEGEGEVFEVGLISNQSIGRSAPSSHPPRYVVRLSGADSFLPWREDAISTLLTILSLGHVRALTLQCAALCVAPELHRKRFRSVAVHRGAVDVFASTLAGDPLMAAGNPFAIPAVHYPRLRSLEFHGIAFGGDSEPEERHNGMEGILDWLAQRKRLFLAIEEIWLVGCTLTAAEYGSLKEVVGHVYVEDG